MAYQLGCACRFIEVKGGKSRDASHSPTILLIRFRDFSSLTGCMIHSIVEHPSHNIVKHPNYIECSENQVWFVLDLFILFHIHAGASHVAKHLTFRRDERHQLYFIVSS